MKLLKIQLVLALCLLQFATLASSYEKRQVTVEALADDRPVIDGLLDDACWQTAQWTCDFVQFSPTENAQPSQKTCFALFYDNNYLYIAIRAHDTAPDSIVRRMTRRDQIDGDFMGVMIDSYYDQRTAFAFLVSAAGVKFDASFSDDGSRRDLNWDPIWLVRTHIDAKGWTAEMRIPFSQLRFNPGESNTWGFQVERRIYRNDESVFWQPFSRSATGWIHQMGVLTGLGKINPSKTFDITPYIVSSAETFQAQKGNPYATGSNFNYNGGLDGKIGLTNYLTLDFTINPDFGQVEADPSEVNLTAYESFFSEKRPFFVEGEDLLNFQLSFGDGSGGMENLFYSRRIGRQPQHHPDAGEDTYVSLAGFTPILGAVKVTGRTPGGMSLGILQTVTANQYAQVTQNGDQSRVLAEPFTNYMAARGIQDFNNGNTIVGIMGTSVHRNPPEEHLQFLHSAAYSGGINLTHYWNDRTYMLRSAGYWSHVRGSTQAISRTQLSPVHYFQRPDAPHLSFNPERTSLTGTGGNIQFWKLKGRFRFAKALLAKSPQLEINDMGYLRFTDQIFQVGYLGYSFTEPVGILRSAGINVNQMSNWNFNRENVGAGGNINYNLQFTNNWSFNNGFAYNISSLATSMLRGGPAFLLPPAGSIYAGYRTNPRRPLNFHGSFSFLQGKHNSQKNRQYNFGITYRPSNSLLLTLTPSYAEYQNNTQYTSTVRVNNTENRYILGHLQQKTIAMSLRVNYTITPDLSLQFWGQPFLSSGQFTEFKKVTQPRAADYHQRFALFPEKQIQYNADERRYTVFEDDAGSYNFRNPDFYVMKFLGNMVVRWEYRPGSTLFLVWSQTRDHYHGDAMQNLYHDAGQLFDIKPHNVFMLKFTYRFGA